MEIVSTAMTALQAGAEQTGQAVGDELYVVASEEVTIQAKNTVAGGPTWQVIYTVPAGVPWVVELPAPVWRVVCGPKAARVLISKK